MKKYYKIKYATEDGSMTFSVSNAAALTKEALSTALDHIRQSNAVKSSTGALKSLVYVKMCEESKIEYPVV